jgi:valyl-tRNA synthetase
MIELEKNYEASKVEADIYKQWEESGYFTPENLPNAENKTPYTIILPPPNVTGNLHVGHALMLVIQDILIRFKRMQGFKTLWLPGTDHAAIATQSKVEKLIDKEEGLRRHDLGREEFLKRVEEFAQKSHDTISKQMRAMGASVDWTREAYTLDETRNFAVRTAFKKMYDDGLIYRGSRVVNFDVKGQTTISDDEIVYEQRKAKLYTFKYSADFPISISTTRPETKVGDTAVAVHPNDARYAEFVGKEFDLQFAGVPIHIKIIADERVEKDFGTGALGVTPAHSQIDFELAQDHNLPLKQVIDERGKMTVGGENLLGKKTTEAREVIVAWLREQNLLEKEEEIDQNVATAERTGGIIEPLPKLQWFVDVNKEFKLEHSELDGIASGEMVSLKKLMRHTIESQQIKITPEHYSKTYFHWIDNLRDWCISRQIWFGHRIPVWYKGDEIYCGVTAPDGEGWEQDSDTLDTWFSSGLWTFSTLGWPQNLADFKTYHPTDVLETGYDILFFWVARMILMTTYLTGQVPFKNIFLHGLIRDAGKQKMSKSKGNIIDPLDMIEKYGTDALRFALIFNTAPGTDIALAEDKIKGMKHFANKLWNISRFILMKLEDALPVDQKPTGNTQADKTILAKLAELEMEITKAIDSFRIHEAAQSLYQFIWHEFADVYIEASKPQLEEPKLNKDTQAILFYCLTTSLKLLHPFMPFITEDIWGKLNKKNLLIVENWPK